MSVVRVGSSKKFAEGWDKVFGGGKKSASASVSKKAATAKKAVKASAKKKAAGKAAKGSSAR